MKISLLASVVASSEIPSRHPRQIEIGEKRYSQLTDMMGFYNPSFDERKYWAYGCNCLILGDRPMSDPGHGQPVDALDTVCKQYKDCVKCALKEYGETCIGEFVKYSYGQKNGDKFCKDSANTCDRALCECDLQFAKNHVGQKDVFNADYHLFWTTTGFNPDDSCMTGGNGAYDPQCCGLPDGPMSLFNANRKQCCDGVVKNEC